MTAVEHRIVLGSDEGVILIAGAVADSWAGSTLLAVQPEIRSDWYEEDDRDEEDDWDDEQDTTGGSDVWILTGDQWGPFSVTARLLDASPGEPAAEWEDVSEASLTCRDGLHITELVNQDDGVVLDTPPGSYRLRVCATGRTGGTDDDEVEEDLDAEEAPVERYLVELWPTTDRTPPVDVRETSAYARAVRAGPPPHPTVEGAEQGLAGSTRIGRDVDRDPGARVLTGDTGAVTVSRRIPATRRRLFRRFGSDVPISRHVPSWSAMAGPDWNDVGGTSYTQAPDGEHPDQLGGTRGIIRSVNVELSSPARHVTRRAWLVPPAGEVTATIDERVPLFEPDTTVAKTYEQVTDEHGQPWTTITVHHSDLPVEWLEDMRAWWAYQLAFLETEFIEPEGGPT